MNVRIRNSSNLFLATSNIEGLSRSSFKKAIVHALSVLQLAEQDFKTAELSLKACSQASNFFIHLDTSI